MRSLMLGDCAHYVSPYIRGVKQAMAILGHDHVEVSIRLSAKEIDHALRSWQPDIIWTHMLLWAPKGSAHVEHLISVVEAAAARGARVVIHDGDAKAATRHPRDISGWCDLALVNHSFDRSAWNVPTLRWPYFAMTQARIATPIESMQCGLFFAGTVGKSPLYAARTQLLADLAALGVVVQMPAPGINTLDCTAEIAASAEAILGFGRPDVPGWVDTRVFQYIAAGGILLHDDVGGYFEPWVHYVPYVGGDASSVRDALDRLRSLSDAERMTMRHLGFAHGQAHHSSIVRVSQVLRALGLAS